MEIITIPPEWLVARHTPPIFMTNPPAASTRFFSSGRSLPQFIVYNAEFIICNAKLIIFNARIVIFNFQFIILNAKLCIRLVVIREPLGFAAFVICNAKVIVFNTEFIIYNTKAVAF